MYVEKVGVMKRKEGGLKVYFKYSKIQMFFECREDKFVYAEKTRYEIISSCLTTHMLEGPL